MGPVLSLAGVGLQYDRAWVLQDIRLELNQGEVLGILGPNGSGKSSLLKVMGGVRLPQKGKILLNGQMLWEFDRSDIAKEIAMVPQENHFRFSFSAHEVVMMGRFPHLKRLQFEGKKDFAIVAKAMETTHTLDLAGRSIHELSGGEKQRVLLARALAQEAKIILMDEPTSFLDLKYKRDFFRLISDLCYQKNLSMAVVSHDLDLVSQYCHRVILLKEGTLFASGTPEDVINEINIETVYDCPVVVDRNPFSGNPRVTVK